MGRKPKRPEIGNELALGFDSGDTDRNTETAIVGTALVDDANISDSSSSPGDSVEPGSIPDANESGTGERKRRSDAGKRHGSRRKNANRKTQAEDAKDLTAVLLSLHMMVSSVTRIEELELSAEEAEQLAVAISRVNELYDGYVIPEKAMAWINLAMAMGTVYGPRVIAYNIRRKREPKRIESVTGVPVN